MTSFHSGRSSSITSLKRMRDSIFFTSMPDKTIYKACEKTLFRIEWKKLITIMIIKHIHAWKETYPKSWSCRQVFLKTVICISVCRLKDKLSPSSSAEENRETELLVQVSQDNVQSTPSEFSTFEIQVSINKLFNCSS